jgi:hypothetical protein
MYKYIETKTMFGHTLTAEEFVAYKKLKKLIEREENYSNNHGMADSFRSYFTEKK